MALDADSCYRALSARDSRFDGRFFVGVTTTGIYCRPVCRARTPRRDRCTFYASMFEAERAGFRACLRCKPELAPGLASIDAVLSLAERGSRAIERGFLNERSVPELAAELGVTDRQLRRAMVTSFGLSPVELAEAHRLRMAKQLIEGSAVPLVEVAYASGFGSVRRFNALFRARYGRAPSELRRGMKATRDGIFTLRLDYRPPLDWEQLLAFFRARALDGLEAVTDNAMVRVVSFGEDAAPVRITPLPGKDALLAEVPTLLLKHVIPLRRTLRAVFDLDADPASIAAHLSRDPALASMVRRAPGLRVAGSWHPFEALVRAVVGQQISVRAARTIASRIVARFGRRLTGGPEGEPSMAFPRAERIARAKVEDIVSLGLTSARAQALRGIAAAWSSRPPFEERRDDAAMVEWLVGLPGVGPWTAQYVAMRAMRSPDAFPSGDLVVRKMMGGVPIRVAEERSEAWRPWRAYATVHLWNGASQGVKP